MREIVHLQTGQVSIPRYRHVITSSLLWLPLFMGSAGTKSVGIDLSLGELVN